jgi:hypothetical protein
MRCAGSYEQINVSPAQVKSRNPGDSAKVAEVRCPECGRQFAARANPVINIATIPAHKRSAQ